MMRRDSVPSAFSSAEAPAGKKIKVVVSAR